MFYSKSTIPSLISEDMVSKVEAIDSVFQHTFELDEKFCDVIVKRYIEQVGSADKVSVQRDGLLYSYAEVTATKDSHAWQ